MLTEAAWVYQWNDFVLLMAIIGGLLWAAYREL